MTIDKPQRNFIQADFVLQTWDDLKPYVDLLRKQEINSLDKFISFLENKSEFDAVTDENLAWRYIKMTIDTTNNSYAEAYSYFINEIQPKLATIDNELNHKINNSEFKSTLAEDDAYKIYFRSIKKSIELFREENTVIDSEINELAQKYSTTIGNQLIDYQGEKITIQKASLLLKSQDESVRKSIFEAITSRQLQDKDELEVIFDQLVEKRNQLALNASYENFRDYKFDALGRFDYTKEDCFNFHTSVKKHIVPLVKEIHQKQAKALNKEKLKPWDLDVDPLYTEALKPFSNPKELVDKTILTFKHLDSYFADCIATMNEMKHLDLESKIGKAPGGYNYPLNEIGVPFIFMNAVGSQDDLSTMVHEGGHAIHSFLSRDLSLTSFKNIPSEVAELASMSMELLSMDYWGEFYSDKDELLRAQKEQLESVLKILPWIATIDEFQHWIYSNPNHTQLERKNKWNEINSSYSTGLVDWSDYSDALSFRWHKQLHLFEVPFYYIEYGIAQLGALAIWKNSKENKLDAIKAYKEALALGYSKTIPEIYKTAGIKFDFSENYIKELANFIQTELNKFN